MSKFLNFKSKQGLSLAYALVVCLFLLMITGGIVSIALLQHNETGSDLNVRQAYISAKSGLDTMEDSFNNSVIAYADLPVSTSGTDKDRYYVMYTDSTGTVQYIVRDTEEEIKIALENISADPNKTIIGGEGSYFKITKNSALDYKITALNLTGKYNNNASTNKSDLSISVALYESYVFGNPRTTVTPIPGGDFLLVGQQTAINEKRSASGTSAVKLLNSMHFNDTSGYGGAGGNQVIYVVDTNNNEDVTTSYAPIVYDKTLRLTSQEENSCLAAYNEGIYFLGSAQCDEINDYAFENGNRKDLGQTSFFTQNGAYAPVFKCSLLVISHNMNAVDKSPKVSYLGSQGRNYVYVYLENNVTFNMCKSDNKVYDYGRSFIKYSGWYKLYNGEIFDQSKWQSCSEPSTAELGCKNALTQIRNYQTNGEEMHSGGPESVRENGENKINILGWDGTYITSGEGSGYSTSDVTDYFSGSYQDRSKMNIFLSPCKGPEATGYYHWYAGKTFNFYWCSTNNFVVGNNAKIRMIAPGVVLTVGPTAKPGVTLSNVIEQGFDSSSFKLYGVQKDASGNITSYAKGAPSLKVMTDITVKLVDGTSYTIVANDTNDPNDLYDLSSFSNGLELFSDEAKTFFTTHIPGHGTTPPSPTPYDISVTTEDVVLKQTDLDVATSITIPKTAKKVLFEAEADKIIDKNGKKCMVISIPYDNFEINKELENGSVVNIMKFREAGEYNIVLNEGTTEISERRISFSGDLLEERLDSTYKTSNYELIDKSDQNVNIPDKGYY